MMAQSDYNLHESPGVLEPDSKPLQVPSAKT